MLTYRARAPSIAAHFFAALVGVLLIGAVDAAQRTFVASYGSDSNPCALTAPCRSFATAITHTDVDGEIIVLDSGGYGRVTVDRSVAITAAPGIYAGISVFAGTNGIDVNGSNIIVRLQGLAINGQGGDVGIAFTDGSRLYVDRCVISNMATGGMRLTTGQTYVADSTIRENRQYGISAESEAVVLVDQSRIERNGMLSAGNAGVRSIDSGSLTLTRSIVAGNRCYGIDIVNSTGHATTTVEVSDSNLSYNDWDGIRVNVTNAGSIVRLAATRNGITQNGGTGINLLAPSGTLSAMIRDNTILRSYGLAGGIHATGAGASVTVDSNAVSANIHYGIHQAGGASLRTRSNNSVQDNGTDTSGTLTPVAGD